MRLASTGNPQCDPGTEKAVDAGAAGLKNFLPVPPMQAIHAMQKGAPKRPVLQGNVQFVANLRHAALRGLKKEKILR